jgi:hypothetical protein
VYKWLCTNLALSLKTPTHTAGGHHPQRPQQQQQQQQQQRLLLCLVLPGWLHPDVGGNPGELLQGRLS